MHPNAVIGTLCVLIFAVFGLNAWLRSEVRQRFGVWRTSKRPRFWRDPDVVRLVPFATTALLESGNLFQLYQMWATGTAAGQSPWGWICVNGALILWLVWYSVFTPEQRFAIWATRIGVAINACVIVSVLYFRYSS